MSGPVLARKREKAVPIAELAVRLGMITPQQHAEMGRLWDLEDDAQVADTMLMLGMVDDAQIGTLLAAQVDAKRNLVSVPPVTPAAPVRAPAPAAAPARAPAAAPRAQKRWADGTPRTHISAGPARAPTTTPPPPVPEPPTIPPAPRLSLVPPPVEAPFVEAPFVEPTADLEDPDAERQLFELLRAALEQGASDIHLHAGASLYFRIQGELFPVSEAPLPSEEVDRLVAVIVRGEDKVRLEADGQVDLCYEAPGIGRFRTNVYLQQRGLDAVLRAIPAAPPSLAELGLPESLARLADYKQGLVLITGPRGCGKSSTMAALVAMINASRAEHVLTIEDPIEYRHTSAAGLVNQRRVGTHTASFARALRGALREDPDVIVIGELRDFESISLAITAAETGHFVLATMHTRGAARTISRLVGAYPPGQQSQVRAMLAESLKAVVSQVLLPTASGGDRAVAYEVLMVNKAVSSLIRDDKLIQIRSAMQTGGKSGMCLLEQCLEKLVAEGRISSATAARCLSEGMSSREEE